MIRKCVPAKLCPYFRRPGPLNRLLQSRWIVRKQVETKSLEVALQRFFKDHSPEKVSYFQLLIFRCWALQDGHLKSEVTDEEFARFLDQMAELVSAAHRYHQRSRGGVTADF